MSNPALEFRKHASLGASFLVIGAAMYAALFGSPLVNILAGFIAAVALFWLRRRHRVIYGFGEVLAGIFTLSQSYHIGRGAFTSAFAEAFQPFQWQVVFLTTVAAVYIIVRGFDNIEQGWKSDPVIRA
jgi:hypothetical protein